MGVRLTILNEEDDILYYGSKLYGYVDDLEESKSLKYLWDIKSEYLIKEHDYKDFEDFALSMNAYTYCDKLCKITIPQLKEFLKLYDEDLQACGRPYVIAEEAMAEIPSNIEYVWLEWG